MNVVFYLSSKYLNFKGNERGISAVSKIAFFTVVVSTAAAILILSAVNGLHEDTLSRIMAKDAHTILLGIGKGISDYDEYVDDLLQLDGITFSYPYNESEALISGEHGVWGAEIKAYPAGTYSNDESIVEEFPLTDGAWDFSMPHGIVIGTSLATNLGVAVGDKVELIVYSDDSMGMQSPFLVVGLFNSGYGEFDKSLAFIEFSDSQEIFGNEGYAHGIAVKVEDPENIEDYYSTINSVCRYSQWNWKRLNRNKIYSLENEKMLMLIILFIFFCVVFFNILSTMIAMVLDKRDSIAILKAMGLAPQKTMSVFLFDGFLLGAFGSTVGILIGLFLAVSVNSILSGVEWIIDKINLLAYFLGGWITGAPRPETFRIFRGDMQSLPILIQYGDILFVVLMAVFVSSLAVFLPANKAAKRRPVDSLRND